VFVADWLYDELRRDRPKSGSFGDDEDSGKTALFQKAEASAGDHNFGDDGF